ncbi:SusC/RagA family TonB-linked outer membrane protein [Pedobacter sp. ASV28]|uniref:SusC/RagA family TonB-linked outer membrane protein n=1 Tax=Pedobacter sp. ASV28 TaxID=2795123 RepID=UPI0018ECE280|nr:SusC/RagA family TonB-linked outer membrane protein [Pedobacter sp. ASV28]
MQKIEKANRFFRSLAVAMQLKNSSIFLFLLFVQFSFHADAQKNPLINSKLSGKVIDARTKEPLAGAVVQIEGVTNQTQTDNDGNFNLITGQSFPYNLIVSYIGYEKKKVTASGSPIIIALQEATNELSGIVITGYNIQKKQDFTGSAARITAKQIENRPAQSFDQLIGGQVAGVNIVQPSGVLNSTPVFRIRGINSISSGIYPLIVIDGVPSFTGQQGGNVGNNPLANINPNDIESIDVLKDASATAIYGSRAANGVVVVTTKRGKNGSTKVSYYGWLNVSTPANLPKLLDAYQYVDIKNESMINAGKQAGFALQTRSDGSVVNTDWYDVAYHTGVSQNHNVSFSGATNTTNYYISLGYGKQNGILRTNDQEQKIARINLEHKLFSNINLGTHISYNNSLGRGPATGSLPGQYIGTDALSRMTYILPPNVAVYNEDGSYNIQDKQRVGYGANNSNASSSGYIGNVNAYNLQLILDLDKYSSESNSLLGDVYGEWEIVKGLKLKTTYGLNKLYIENLSFQNGLHGDAGAANGAATNTNRRLSRTDWANTLTYNRTFADKHNLNALVGYEEILTTVDSWGAQRTGLSDPLFNSYQGGFTTITPTGNSQGRNGFISYFANLNYSYASKYLLSYSFRRDGYSGLPRDNRFGNFSGGSIGWVLSEEDFYKNSTLATAVNRIKLKASYGEVGNINIGDFPSLGLYGAATYNGIPTLGFTQAGNDQLKWETSKKSNIGLAISFLNDRLSLEADYYYNKVDGLILDAKQAPSKGIPGNVISANVGSLYNKGLELSLSAAIVQHDDFKWNANFNISTLKNKVTTLFNGTDIYTPSNFGIQNMTREGYSIGSIWAVPTDGVNSANGNRIFINRNNERVQYNHIAANKWTYLDGTVAPAIDNYLDGRIQGPSLPTYYGGLNNSFSYKRFDLDFGFIFSGGNKLYNGTRANLLDQRYFNNGTFVLDRWTTPGQVTDIPKLYFSDNVSTGFSITNAAMVEDGSFVKLKNLALGYRLPVQKVFNGKVTALRLYAQATNLFTITNYSGSDPEISINGNAIASGKDHNAVVNARTFALGINLQF